MLSGPMMSSTCRAKCDWFFGRCETQNLGSKSFRGLQTFLCEFEPPDRRGSITSIFAQHADHCALHLAILHDDRLEIGVGRLKADLVALLEERLERGLAVRKHGDDAFAV